MNNSTQLNSIQFTVGLDSRCQNPTQSNPFRGVYQHRQLVSYQRHHLLKTMTTRATKTTKTKKTKQHDEREQLIDDETQSEKTIRLKNREN
jgi:hypothetical protein